MQPQNDLNQIPAARQSLLRSARYMLIQLTDCDVWASRAQRKIFLFQWVERHGIEDLRRELDSLNSPDAWKIYSDDPPPVELARRVERVIG